MQIADIEIIAGQPEFEYEAIRRIEVKCEASNAFMPAPTVEEANGRLRVLAAKVGATAIIEASYDSGVSFTSWKSLKAKGLAVRRISDERACPFCAETIKRAATVCKHCGRELPPAAPIPQPSTDVAPHATAGLIPAEPLKDNNNPAIIIALILAGIVLIGAVIAASS